MATSSIKPASQRILEIDEIRDGIVIIKNKGLRSILMCSSINLALKSTEEQDAIITEYQNFLNTLDFSLQFFISSRKLNIEPYLDTLRARAEQETNELLKIQTNEYIEFMRTLVESEYVVTKTFYVVVPYQTALSGAEVGIVKKMFNIFQTTSESKPVSQVQFEEWRTQLYQRVDVVRQGLARIGIRAVPLATEELIELFYGLYNPDESESRAVEQYVKAQQ